MKFESLEQRQLLTAAPGEELLVNQFANGTQATAPSSDALAADASGNFVVTFSGRGPHDHDGVYARTFDKSGQPLTDQFLVNQTTFGWQGESTVAQAENGDIVVAWSGKGTGDYSGVFFRRFDSSGTPLTGEIRANATRIWTQSEPAIGLLADGTTVIAWSGFGVGDFNGVFYRRFAADGTPLGGETNVTSRPWGWESEPAIATAEDGGFAIAWSELRGFQWRDVYIRRFHADGSADGDETRVNYPTNGTQKSPAIGMDAEGEITVVWHGTGPGDWIGVWLRRFSADGTALGDQDRVNDTAHGIQRYPSISMRNDGSSVVTWESYGQDGSLWGIFGQEYDASGNPVGPEIPINQTTTKSQQYASVAADEASGFTVAWSGRGVGDNQGVFVRRYGETNQPPVLDPIDDFVVEIGETISFSATATDDDDPPGALTFSLGPGAPEDASIEPQSGLFEWTPTDQQTGPHFITVIVADDGTPALTDEQTFQVTVLPDALVNLVERGVFVDEEAVLVDLDQTNGRRELRIELFTNFDVTDQSTSLDDLFSIYLVDPNDPSQTLLDRGTNGTSLFSLSREGAKYVPGVVRFDGQNVVITVDNLPSVNQGQLLFQLLNSDDDNGSFVSVLSVDSVVVEDDGLPLVKLSTTQQLAAVGPAIDLSTLSETGDVVVGIQNVRFDSAIGKYLAELKVRNNGGPIGRQIAVLLPGVPAGVAVLNASGVDTGNVPYFNLTPAVSSGGLPAGGMSQPVQIQLDNPNLLNFAFRPIVLSGGMNSAPVLDPVGPLMTVPGGYLAIDVGVFDPDGDEVALKLESSDPLPRGILRGNQLIFTPKPGDEGTYNFNLVASDGALTTKQAVTLEVQVDPITTTRISGVVMSTNGDPLVGVPIEIGTLQTTTDANGSFMLETPAAFPSDTLFIRANALTGSQVYPFIAEKLALLLGHAVYENASNVIGRAIYLPALDVDNGVDIDPTIDNVVTTPNLPGVELLISKNTLEDQQGQPFMGKVSITQVPTALTPAALPDDLRPDLVVTIQPGELVFTTPAPISFPNTAGYDLGTMLDLWSINPVTGTFEDVGDMLVVDDPNNPGETIIQTISGGIRNSSWHFPAPPEPNPDDPGDDKGNEDNDCDECKATKGNFEVELHSGAVLEDHALVSYQSLGQTQGFALHYDSLRADPRPIVHFGYSNVQANANQRLVATLEIMRGDFMFQVPGYSGTDFGLQGGEHIWKLDSGGTVRVAVQTDFTELPTGVYDYNIDTGLLQFNGSSFAGSMTTRSDQLKVVNLVDSPFGSGWGLTGLQQIVENPDGSVLLFDGDGSELYFAAATSPGDPLVSPPGDFSTLVKLGDGTYQRTMKDQTVYRFNEANQIASMTDRNGNLTTFEYDAVGLISRITDPAGLVTFFETTDGRITSITDPANRTTLLDYNDAGDLIQVTDPDGTTRVWEYDAQHRMTAHVDKRGFREEVMYDFAGRAERGLLKDGSEQFYDPVQTQVLRPFAETTDALNPPSVSTINDIIAHYADPNGNATEYRLDQQGQTVSSRDNAGVHPSVGRDDENLVTRSTDGRGFVSTFQYDASGNVSGIRDTISRTGVSGLDHQGEEFWLSFQRNAGTPSLALFVTGDVATSGTVDISGIGFSQDFAVAPGEVTTINIPASAAVTQSDTISSRALHVTADDPIAVYGLNQIDATTDGFLGLPVDVLGLEYLVMSASGGRAGTQFAVVATEDNTDVTIIPSDTVGGRSAGVDYTVSLQRGEVYMLSNFGAGTIDLTGTSVSASAPVSVFGGHECAFVPPNTFYCDHLTEQLTPVETWGTTFVTAPLATRTGGDTFRVLAAADETEVTIDGNLVATLDRGEFFDTILTTESVIAANKGVLVAQFSHGSNFDGALGDPFMQLIPPVEQFANDYTVTTPASGFNSHFINIIAPDSAVGFVQLDGVNIDESQFTSVPASGFSVAQVPVAAGTHNVSSPAPIGLYIYGFGSFDSYGYLGGQRFAPINQKTFTYDETFSQLISATDELGRVTLHDIDPSTGNILKRTRVIGELDDGVNGETDNLITTYTYTTFGLLDTMTDPLGRVMDYNYDALGRLEQVTYALGTVDEATMSYEYDLAGNQIAMIDGNGNRTDYEYDELNRLLGVIEPDPDGSGPLTSPITEYTYDAMGNLETMTDARGNTTTNVYDEKDQMVESIGPDPDGGGPLPAPINTYEYDPAGNIASLTDPNGNTTQYVYDARNRRTAMIDPDGGVTGFVYDTDNNLARVTDPVGNVTQFMYDARDRLVEETDPLGATITYTYDAVDNLIRKTDRNSRVTLYEYDDINRLLTEAWLDTDGQTSVNTVAYAYDKASNLLSVDDSFSALAYTYDARDRVQTVDNLGTPGAPNVVLTYAYDDNSNVLSVTDTIDGAPGATTGYAYDGLDRLIELTQTGANTSDKRVDFAYNPLGQYASIDRFSDLAGTQLVIGTDYTYDDQNRLTRIDHQNSGGTSVAFYDYVYDTASRITQITDVDGVTTYTYDDRDELTGADHTDANQADESYEYDANGNRVDSHLHGTGYVTGPANRLMSDGTYNYEYDAEGNMTRRTEIATGDYRVFEWDHRNRLVAVSDFLADDTPVQTVEFRYDAINRRISKAVDTTPEDAVDAVLTHFVYDREDVVLDFVDPDGSGAALPALVKRYLHGPGIDYVLAQENGTGDTEWLLSDHIGSTRDLVDASGDLHNHIVYDAYGNVLTQTDEQYSTRYLFTGREVDTEVDLVFFRSRYYATELGRFLNEDPSGVFPSEMNPHRYAGNSPTMAVDPSGREHIDLKLDPKKPHDFLKRLERFADQQLSHGGGDLGHRLKLDNALRHVKKLLRNGKISKKIARAARRIAKKAGPVALVAICLIPDESLAAEDDPNSPKYQPQEKGVLDYLLDFLDAIDPFYVPPAY